MPRLLGYAKVIKEKIVTYSLLYIHLILTYLLQLNTTIY